MIRHASVVDPVVIQLAAEGVLGALCMVGYRVEGARGRMIAAAPVTDRSVVTARVIGDGDWIVIGSSEEQSFESMSATPMLRSSGFSLEIEGARVAIASGTQIEIRTIEGARRAPLDAMTTAQGLKTRFTFEVRPGTTLYTDYMAPASNAYRAHDGPARTVVLAGERSAAMRKEASFPGCWIMILVPGVLGAVIATLAGAYTAAWILLGAATALLLVGWIALPSIPKPS